MEKIIEQGYYTPFLLLVKQKKRLRRIFSLSIPAPHPAIVRRFRAIRTHKGLYRKKKKGTMGA